MRPVQDAFLDLLKSTLDSEISFIKIIRVISAKNTATKRIFIIEDCSVNAPRHLIGGVTINTLKCSLQSLDIFSEIGRAQPLAPLITCTNGVDFTSWVVAVL